MKWKPLLAALLGLLMVGVTAGSAAALSTETPHYNPITTQVQRAYYLII
ncbi:MAG: hypothetical protein J7L37_00060 [Thermococcus sp.]|nr:hypothetical protein [Thermococcus sp.]